MKKLTILLFFILLLNSCGVNEDIPSETKAKSTTFTEKVDIDEVLTQLKIKNPELASFIENNPFTNLKTNTGKTDYYFDFEHIVAIKNNKNEVAYTIPLYLTTEDQSKYIHKLSVEITPTSTDIQLITIEGMDDDTVKYSTHQFDPNQKKSLTSKTAQIDCYCITTVSDCTCHKTHASGGCDHPSVETSCSCSGSGSFGTSQPNNNGTGTNTSWAGGSGSPISYTPTGDGIYIALNKKFRADYQFTAIQKYNIINMVPFSQKFPDFLNEEGDTPINKAFVIQMLNRLEDGIFAVPKQLTIAIQNFKYSLKSPLNVDMYSILDKPTLAENQKFLAIYNALSKSPEFQKLFIDMFGNNTRFNVKFEIADHVYEDDDPQKKEVNAITSEEPVTKNITIKISKQILIPGTDRSQTQIENAKTILHECVHAYLFVKANNPTIGTDFVKILNTMYPTANEQHDFMYNKMIPTMQKILSEIRDLVTTSPKRTILETQYTMHPTTNPISSTPWSWNDYYKYLSLSGLQETNSFIQDFPFPSDKYDLYKQYINAGKNELDR